MDYCDAGRWYTSNPSSKTLRGLQSEDLAENCGRSNCRELFVRGWHLYLSLDHQAHELQPHALAGLVIPNGGGEVHTAARALSHSTSSTHLWLLSSLR